jgi:choline dehydrogenase
MNCRKFKRLWSARLTGELSPDARDHLSSCAACAKMAERELRAVGWTGQPSPRERVPKAPPWSIFRLSRRGLMKATLAGLLASVTTSVTTAFRRAQAGTANAPAVSLPPDAPVEYIVVGSGAGGGPLACNLARAGHKVALFEAGGDDADDVTSVPYFTVFASEDPRIKWDYFVRHYADQAQQQRDFKYVASEDGIWYPRVGNLGGCTIHTFLFATYPSDSDWDHIAQVTGDGTWNSASMRQYFQRLERCRYLAPQGNSNPSLHGFDGWQPTEMPNPLMFALDTQVRRILRVAAQTVLGEAWANAIQQFFASALDPNDWRVQKNREGMYNTPLFRLNGVRYGPRQFIRETAAALPNNLIVKTHALVTRVLFDGTTAIGVEYLEGEHLYRADPNAPQSGPEPGPRQTMLATREVILSAGSFNTPQILKLSGVGPADELTAHGISPIVDLPGVGENLNDRYEVSVVTKMKENFTVTADCRPGQPDDPCMFQWLHGTGPYTSVPAVSALFVRSDTARAAGRPDPDLFIFNALGRFRGYFPGYSYLDVAAADGVNQFTWAVLKAHTLNHAGTVKLRSADPRDTPLINFHYFEEGSDTAGEDLASVADGVQLIRRMNADIADISQGEFFPGAQVKSRSEIKQYIRDEAWGHHASCTCKMGPASDPMAVVDSEFRVHGTSNLRVVDASVFPRIPGYFILMPIYMISEKASDVILAGAS